MGTARPLSLSGACEHVLAGGGVPVSTFLWLVLVSSLLKGAPSVERKLRS